MGQVAKIKHKKSRLEPECFWIPSKLVCVTYDDVDLDYHIEKVGTYARCPKWVTYHIEELTGVFTKECDNWIKIGMKNGWYKWTK